MESNEFITEATTTELTPIGLNTFSTFSGLGDRVDGSSFFNSLLNFTNDAWTIFTIVSYTFSIVLLFIYVYASTERKQLHLLHMEELKQRERIYDERFRSGPKNSRFADIEKHIASDNPNDWKLAIIEADIVLDEALKKLGYNGVSLGERLKSITPSQLTCLDDAWQAHKIRNQIAHGGADFVLTKRLAEETIKRYRRVFTELGAV
ncbi:MAG: hypothetical protein KBC78_00495 [Candidatus Pacebacteria bacterium]|nr:hypothetical protein [Candidatus Paceibacterota bacterium]